MSLNTKIKQIFQTVFFVFCANLSDKPNKTVLLLKPKSRQKKPYPPGSKRQASSSIRWISIKKMLSLKAV